MTTYTVGPGETSVRGFCLCIWCWTQNQLVQQLGRKSEYEVGRARTKWNPKVKREPQPQWWEWPAGDPSSYRPQHPMWLLWFCWWSVLSPTANTSQDHPETAMDGDSKKTTLYLVMNSQKQGHYTKRKNTRYYPLLVNTSDCCFLTKYSFNFQQFFLSPDMTKIPDYRITPCFVCLGCFLTASNPE